MPQEIQPPVSYTPVGATNADHAYYTVLAALLEPMAIEALQSGTYTYAINSSTTKYILGAWNSQIASSGRFEVRDVRKPLALRGVTLTGVGSGSHAVILDPSVGPPYSSGFNTYFDRLNAIDSYVTRWTALSGTTRVPWLPGPYGSIVTGVTVFDEDWIGLYLIDGTGTFNLTSEISDTTTQRVAHSMLLPVWKNVLSSTNQAGAGSGGITHVILPSSWSAIPDPVNASYDFRDDFMGATLDTSTIWTRAQSTTGNVEINTTFAWCKCNGNGSWGTNGAYRQTSVARSAQKRIVVDVSPRSAGGVIVGWSDGGGHSYTNFAHGIHFNSGGSIECYENGNDRGVVGSGWTADSIYRIRIRALSGGGATYEIQGDKYNPLGGASWTTITPGTTTSATSTLYAAFSAHDNTAHHIGDVRVY